MGRAPCCEKVGLNRGPWTREEDMRLIQYIKTHGEGSWRTLPKAAGLLRCGKSCRLRWINYLRPDLKRGNISEEEDRLIIKLHSLLGNRWSLISGRLPGRTDNEIKNYWNTHLKKKLRNMGIDPQTHQPLEKVQPPQASQSITPVTVVASSAYGIRYDLSSAAGHVQPRRLTPAVASPALNFKAKPIAMDPTQLDALKRAASLRSNLQANSASTSSQAVSSTVSFGETHFVPPTASILGPSSPASIMYSSSSLTVEHKDASSPSQDLVHATKQPQNSVEPLLWSPSLPASASHTRRALSECSSGSSMESAELLRILAELYPRSEAMYSSGEDYNCMKLEDDSKFTELQPSSRKHNSNISEMHDTTKELVPSTSVLSFLESDFMWDIEMMHPIEDVGTPTGVLPSTSSDLWAHDSPQADGGSVPSTWLNEHDR